MKRIKTSADNFSNDELVAYARRAKEKLEKETTFNALEDDLVKLGAAAAILEKCHKDFDQAEKDTLAKLHLRDGQRKVVLTLLTVVGAGVEHTAAGDTDVLLASPFDLQAPKSPIGPLPAPQNVRVTVSAHEGELLARWKPVSGARTYLVECRLEDSAEWTLAGAVTRSKMSLTRLIAGKKYRIRVRAVGTAGAGPWSDEVVKIAA